MHFKRDSVVYYILARGSSYTHEREGEEIEGGKVTYIIADLRERECRQPSVVGLRTQLVSSLVGPFQTAAIRVY